MQVFIWACLAGVAAALPLLGILDRSMLMAPERARIVEHRTEDELIEIESDIAGASEYTTETIYIVVGELDDGTRWEIHDQDLHAQTAEGITVSIRRARLSGTIREITSERVDWLADDAGFLLVWAACAATLAACITAIVRRFQLARRPAPPGRAAPEWWDRPLPQTIAGLLVGAGTATALFLLTDAAGPL
jgi:hypothetical protein